MATLTLASDKQGFGELVVNNEAQLLDLPPACSAARRSPISKSPKPARWFALSLLTVFNNALGAETVQDLYLTEFAIQ